MRKLLAYLVAALMLISSVAAMAEPVEMLTPAEAVEPAAATEPAASAEPAAEPAASAEPTATAEPIVVPAVTRVEDYEELVVGTTTALSGSFFTEMWGDNTSDIDVRFLLHGYNLMEWEDGTGAYGMDASVVSALVGTQAENGDRTYNVALYDDLYYSDGMPVTAYDYAFSILLSMSPVVTELGGQTTDSDYLVGAAAYKAGETDVLSGVRIINDHQFTITVDGDYLPFFYELALLDYNPYPIHVIAPGCTVDDDGEGIYIRNMTEEELAAQSAEREAGAERVAAALAAENEERAATGLEPLTATVEELVPEAPEVTLGDAPLFTAELLRETILDDETGYLSHPSVVSGPYRLVTFDAEAHTASFERNVMYKGDSTGTVPTIERLVMRPVEPESMIEALASGEVDLLHKVVNADAVTVGMQLVAQNEGMDVSNYPRSGLSLISFSCEREITSSQAVRQAVAHCLDKTALVSEYVGNYGLEAGGYYGLGQWMYQMVQGTLSVQQDAGAAEGSDAAEGDAAATGAAEGADGTAEGAEEEPVVFTMDNIPTYALDIDAAVELLEGDGWTFNRDGEPYDPATDDVRCKRFEDGAGERIVPLELTLAYPEGNAIGEVLETALVDHLAEAGVKLTLTAMPMDQLLRVYYREEPREVDMIYLATNFATVFDPSSTFNPADAYQGAANRTGIADDALYLRAVDMRMTEPGDVISYCQKWIAFQERYMEVLPAIPVYSNVYFDFYTRILQGYEAGSNQTWSQAMPAAYLSDAPDEAEEEAAEEASALAEGELIIE